MQTELIKWYTKNKRDLPWRHTHDPYKIWISEIMLQQTTVEAVIPYYLRFIKEFPDINTLSKASLEKVYKYWEGLGYYRRAKYIHETAIDIHNNYHDIFPDNYHDIIALKGIGAYTTGAILSIAFHKPYSAVDGNALRIISRYYLIKENIAQSTTIKHITKILDNLIIGYDPGDFNQGLMDLGSMICRPLNPKCEECPLNLDCQAYIYNQQNVLPINIKKIKHQEIHYITGIIEYHDQLLLIKNPPGLLENLYGFIQYEGINPYDYIEKFEKQYHTRIEIKSYIKDIKHVFTHRTWIMHVYIFQLLDKTDNLYTHKEIENIPISTAHSKVLQAYLKVKL